MLDIKTKKKGKKNLISGLHNIKCAWLIFFYFSRKKRSFHRVSIVAYEYLAKGGNVRSGGVLILRCSICAPFKRFEPSLIPIYFQKLAMLLEADTFIFTVKNVLAIHITQKGEKVNALWWISNFLLDLSSVLLNVTDVSRKSFNRGHKTNYFKHKVSSEW